MVFFTCNNCGESLKKKAVEKHSFKCRNSQGICCIDCHKTFGNDYVNHLTCISEQEKYGGSNYVSAVPKGVKKQEDWADTLRKVAQDLEPQFKMMLIEATKCPNIPRNRKKFQNFVLSQLRIKNPYVEKFTDVVFRQVAAAAAQEAQKPPVKEKKEENKQEETKKRKQTEGENILAKKMKDGVKENSEDGERENANSEVENGDQMSEKSKKKKSKRKTLDNVEENENVANGDVDAEEMKRPKKKKKRKGSQEEAEIKENGTREEISVQGDLVSEVNETPGKKKKSKSKSKAKNEKDETNGESEMGEAPSKKRKKCKNQENDVDIEDENSNIHSKKQNEVLDTTVECENTKAATTCEENGTSPKRTAEFKWKTSIKQTLKAHQSRMKFKKLEKVMVEEYLKAVGNHALENEAKELFKQKINNDKFIIEDRYVKLK